MEKLISSYLTLRNLQRSSLNIRLNFLDDLGKCCVKQGLIQNSQIESYYTFGTCSISPFGYHAITDIFYGDKTCIFCGLSTKESFTPINAKPTLKYKIECLHILQKSCAEVVRYVWGYENTIREYVEDIMIKNKIKYNDNFMIGYHPCYHSPCGLHVMHFDDDNASETYRCIFCGGKDEKQKVA